MGMIYGSSNHPVEVKKILLDVWSLRSEIEAIIREKYSHLPENEKPSLDEIIKEYSISTAHGAPNMIVLDGAPADEDAEDDFSKAMAEAIDNPDADDVKIGDEENSETEGEQTEEDDEAAKAAAEMLGDQVGGDESDDKSEADQSNDDIFFRRPNLQPHEMGRGTLFLADLSMMDICFFSTKNFIAGQTIVLEFLIPKKFALTAEVLFCKNYSIQSRIISETRPTYRIHARFSFIRKGERTLLRNFCSSITPEIPPEAPKAKVKEEEDDFDDLDDLGL